MLRFTLLKVGRKRTTDYRIVVREKRSAPRSQKYIELVGTYNTKTKKLSMKRDRILYWLSQGVQPSGTVHNMFVREKVISGPKMAVTPRTRLSQATASPATSSGAPPAALSKAPAIQSEKAPSSAPQSQDAAKEPEKKTETEGLASSEAGAVKEA